MKKILIVLILSLLCFSVSALTLLDTREVLVNMHVPIFATLTLTPSGDAMPFDITGSNVAYNSSTYSNGIYNGTGGLRIATWIIEANMNSMTLEFSATPLANAADSASYLNYYLFFNYSYYRNGDTSNQTPISGNLVVHSGNSSTIASLSNGPVYFRNKDIRFMFDEDADPNASNFKDGAYYATLTITLTEGTN